jgi:hypothetical protein
VPISAVDSISPAFQHAKRQLLEPFRFSQWSRLALVGLLAGELSSGGGCNFSVPKFPRNPGGSEHFLAPSFPFPSANPLLVASLVAVLAVAALVLWLFLLYVNSVMRFVLFDSVVEKECRIRRGWSRRQGSGARYFVWKILIFLGAMAGLTFLIGIPAALAFSAGWLKNPGQHILPLVLGGMVLFFFLFAFVVGLLVLQVLSKDFMVPQMALENISAFEAWRRLWAMLQREKGGYAGYLAMKVVMAIGAAIIVGIVAVILMIVLLIPVGGLGVVAVLAGKAAGLTWNAYTITVIVVGGSVVVAGILYLFALISVPVIVFFPAYSIYFFAARYPPLAAVLYPKPPAPPLMPSEPEAIG